MLSSDQLFGGPKQFLNRRIGSRTGSRQQNYNTEVPRKDSMMQAQKNYQRENSLGYQLALQEKTHPTQPEEPLPTTIFNSQAVPKQNFTQRVSQYLKGLPLSTDEPANPGNLRLITEEQKRIGHISKHLTIEHSPHEMIDFDVRKKQPPIFQQVPFWKNLNDQSIMSSQINESARKDNKYIDLDTLPSATARAAMGQATSSRASPAQNKTIEGGPTQFSSKTQD